MRRTLNKLTTFAKLVTPILPRLPGVRLQPRPPHRPASIPTKRYRQKHPAHPKQKPHYAKTTTNMRRLVDAFLL